ncbi:MAG: magnesium transporter [Alphaproteobacteria bacterium]|nr:magnesium transporter [Alphaproteobacteria bacterium]MDP6563947.1 magnesium transporter [Alphaproteobacteria bacterium]MDP6815383.1 magnesium transporter [Alphaproteobacteria bacterium]
MTLDEGSPAEVPASFDDVYAVSTELVRAVETALDEGRPEEVRELLAPLRAADVADLIVVLSREDRLGLVGALGDDLDPETMVDLDGSVLAELLGAMSPQAVANAILELESDEAVHLLEDMDEDRREAVLGRVPPPDRAAVLEGLSFPEDSAGRLMQRELIAVPAYWTVGQVIDYCRDTDELPDEFYEIFVIDPRHRPIGQVALNRLMRTRRPVLMREIMAGEATTVPVDMDQEEVAFLFQQYRLASAPVVDDAGRLVGVITFDDAAAVLEEEAEEDLMRLSGVSSETDLLDSALRTTRSRSTWLLLNLATAILASAVIAMFDGTIEQIVALAILMPIVASMGGNAGTQTLTVAVRALATRELTAANALRIVGKEVVVGGLNGVVFAVLMGLVAGFWFSAPGIGVVIAAAMIVNMVVAGLAGTLIPLGLARAGIDPAVAATVFLTTITDVVGFFVFLGLAALFLL